MCMHKISFSVNGGLSDILKIKFINHVAGAKVHFAVGRTFYEAKGETIYDLKGKYLRVSFPNSIFLVVEYFID